jgi:hypothetical protein
MILVNRIEHSILEDPKLGRLEHNFHKSHSKSWHNLPLKETIGKRGRHITLTKLQRDRVRTPIEYIHAFFRLTVDENLSELDIGLQDLHVA